MTFQLLQKQFQCKPHCAINSSQCSLDPSQHVEEKKGANIEGEGRPLNAEPESANKEDKSGVSSRRELAFDVAPYSKEEKR